MAFETYSTDKPIGFGDRMARVDGFVSQRRDLLLLLAQILSHAGLSQALPRRRWASMQFCLLGFSRPNTVKWLLGCRQDNRLSKLSNANLKGWRSDATANCLYPLPFLLFLSPPPPPFHSPFLLSCYWAIQAGLLTPLTFARHRLSPMAAFTSGAYFLHNGRRWQWICEFYTANVKGIFWGT